jgi:hypothetical protein
MLTIPDGVAVARAGDRGGGRVLSSSRYVAALAHVDGSTATMERPYGSVAPWLGRPNRGSHRRRHSQRHRAIFRTLGREPQWYSLRLVAPSCSKSRKQENKPRLSRKQWVLRPFCESPHGPGIEIQCVAMTPSGAWTSGGGVARRANAAHSLPILAPVCGERPFRSDATCLEKSGTGIFSGPPIQVGQIFCCSASSK